MPRLNTVALVGVGLIGGSIGLALRQRKLARRVIGIGHRASTLRSARELGAIDATTTNLRRGVADAELVVVCTPVASVVENSLEAARHSPAGAVITDVGSTKFDIVAGMERARSELAARQVEFVGSHPLAGSEKRGPQSARADLFRRRLVVMTPARRSTTSACRRIEGFWKSLGATILHKTPQAHDQAVAAISHFPHVVASALAASTPEIALALAAGGWQDSTRIAAGDPELWRQILVDNKDHVLKSFDKFEKVLASFREALECGEGEALLRLLREGKRNRDAVGN